MTVDVPYSDWPMFQPDGAIRCPACGSDEVEDTGQQLSEDQLDSMHVGSAPNWYLCRNEPSDDGVPCGNQFLPVDASEHPILRD